mgnify:CR=1 FL=1
MNTVDKEIQELLNDDDPRTLDLNYDSYGEALFGYLSCLVCSRHDAEDCLQDLFILIARKRHLLKEKENLKAYLMTMARNEAMAFFRKRKRHIDTIECDESLLAPTNTKDELPVKELSQALTSIPLDQRDIIFLKIYQQMTFKQIAQQLRISENTAASRYRYGLKKMKQLMLQVET